MKTIKIKIIVVNLTVEITIKITSNGGKFT